MMTKRFAVEEDTRASKQKCPAAIKWHIAMAEHRAAIGAESVTSYYERMGINEDDLKRVAGQKRDA